MGGCCVQAQHSVLQQLKAGELDIVISTAVAEEGLDVKQCQLVIRFDLPSTLLAFVQSRSSPLLQAQVWCSCSDHHHSDDDLLILSNASPCQHPYHVSNFVILSSL